MNEIEYISKEKLICEEAVEIVLDQIIKTIGTVKPEERNKVLENLTGDTKTQTLTEMDEFEKTFREKIQSQKEFFISDLLDFYHTFNPTSEQKANFIIKIIGDYALHIVQTEIGNNHKKKLLLS